MYNRTSDTISVTGSAAAKMMQTVSVSLFIVVVLLLVLYTFFYITLDKIPIEAAELAGYELAAITYLRLIIGMLVALIKWWWVAWGKVIVNRLDWQHSL